MTQMAKKQKDETTLQFFTSLQIPPTMKHIGENDFSFGHGNYSYGKIYLFENKVVRIAFFWNKGTICEKDRKTDAYKCITTNKTSEQINEIIQENYEKTQR